MNVAAMRENGEKGINIQNVEWVSDGYAGLDIERVLMNKDEVIFVMITKRPVGWWALKVEASLENQWETQGNSTTLCVFQKKSAYPRGSAQHSSFEVGMTFLSQNLSIVGRWNDPYNYRTTGLTVVDQVARKFVLYGLNQKESRHTSSSDAFPPEILLTPLASSMLSCMETLGGERHKLKLSFFMLLND
ncbi:hypothetical protein BOTCAL_0065g00130 [Botryotinia calthae]|uniref:Uncharacterized protein n=1 Tax=Botryotinia calthae TaxID=38488 RepID=A0A4Y8D9K9_9HELO|nr:hypothetical protein BOTCAL_0065g00130 [Botryotinia calthae]